MGHTISSSNSTAIRFRGSHGKLIKLPFSLHRGLFIDQAHQDKNKSVFGVIAIDTEYQTPSEAINFKSIKEGWARATALSYQYCCYIYDPDQPDVEVWSDVIYPDKGKRLRASDLLIAALHKARSEGGVQKLPLNWYMAGHFTRADLPMFADFASLNKAVNAVRGSFTSVEKAVEWDIDFLDDQPPIKLQIKVRDTMHLLPEGQKSLAAVGKLIGMEKVSLAEDPDLEQFYKDNMAQYLEDNLVMFEVYAVTDAIITAAYVDQVLKRAEEMTGKLSLPVTLTGLAITLLEKDLEKQGKSRLSVLGKEEIKERVWHQDVGAYRTVKKEVYIPNIDLHVKLATECYRGGRNEQFWFGSTYTAYWTDFDLAGAYPTAMALLRTPDWSALRVEHDVTAYTPTTLGMAYVEFSFPDGTRFPVLPVRTANGLVFPLEGQSYCGAPEISLALSLGASIKIKHGIIIPYADDERVFGSFIRFCVDKRSKEPKGSLMNLLWKESANSTYGKLAQGLREKRVFDNRDGDMKRLPESKITQPFFAGFTTSFIRAALGEIMNRLSATANVNSVTTDGFLTDANETQIEHAVSGPICKIFGESRAFLNGKYEVLEKKHEVRRLLGWRTRGQATLEAGLTGRGDAYNIVLAKAGIYTSRDYEAEKDRNDYIVRMFFNRKFNQIIEVFSKTGLRAIVQDGADLVEVSRFKRLGMEYDFKRKPHSVVMDPSFNHVSFSTTPWKSVAEFQIVRENLEAYLKTTSRCIKSTEDFQSFASYLLSKTTLQGKKAAYVKTDSGDIKRLRQSLASAWRRSEAGLRYREGAKTASEFASLLVTSGVPCKREDVENAAKKPFIPHNVPPTPEVRAALQDIKNHFTGLDTDLILADIHGHGAIDLLSATNCVDQFTRRLIQPT